MDLMDINSCYSAVEGGGEGGGVDENCCYHIYVCEYSYLIAVYIKL